MYNIFRIRELRHALHRFIWSMTVAALLVPFTFAQTGPTRSPKEKQEYKEAMEQADLKIDAEVKDHSELMKNLEYLTTRIGPRLTGSQQMQDAANWALKRFQDYGIDAHLETTEIPHAWYRGADTAEITAPITRRIEVRSAGWSKATPGEISGRVIYFDPDNLDKVESMKGDLKGAIAMVRFFSKPSELGPPAENSYDAVIPPPRGVPTRGAGSLQATFAKLGMAMKAFTEAGGAAILFDSGKPFNLFNMTSFGGNYQPSAVPMAFLTHEDFELLRRLQNYGAVTMKLDLKGTFSPGPVPVSITVAEIKGSAHPDERVIIGGHLDSWDLGQGALDNGTGAMAVMEAARTLKSLGWKPDRTITFILFTGEEEAGTGAELFVKNHQKEIDKMDAVLVDDVGTGKIFTIAMEHLYETAPLMEEIYKPLQEVFDLEPLSTRYFGSSDHVEFLNAGVPAYLGVQKPAHYGEAHHSQADTFDLVIPDEVNEGAALLAAWAWNVSQMPPALPHHAPEHEQ